MSKEKKRFLITSALPYANGPLHLGHLSGAYLPADIYVRYLRSRKKDVVYICGSDENGAAITIKAKLENTTPREIVDKYFELNKKTFERFGISFDIFHRTSLELHHKTASDFFLKLHEKGVFEQKTSEQYYDVEQNQFLADRYIYGTCPKCSYDHAYGDQCEKCGSSLSPRDLISPKSTLSEKEPVLKFTTHWYLPMEKHGDWLRDWIEDGKLNGHYHHNPKEWKNNVLGQCKSWLDSGLQPRAMTRDLDWGIKVPLADAEGKVLYVWLDAPIGYISATKQWAIDNQKEWEPYWMDNDTKLVHFIGKDNIVFHCIVFPILLKTHGDFILPDNVPANEFLNLEGNKISTSRNWAIWVHEYLDEFPGKQDELRYVLTSIAPENKDSEFTWKDYQTRINNELVANYGNFVNRTLVLTNKYYNGLVPDSAELKSIDLALIDEFKKRLALTEQHLEAYRFKEALNEAMNAARAGNKYLGDTEPWKLEKTDPERVKTILNTALQLTVNLAGIFNPFLPDSSEKIFNILKIDALKWNDLGSFSHLTSQHQIEAPALLFEKVEDKTIELQLAKLHQKSFVVPTSKPQKQNITFEDFSKLDIRIGEIVEAEKVPKTDKLLKLTINTGLDKRTVVSGIANSYNTEEIIGKKVSILLNLSPRKIKGVLSEGMILMAENEKGDLSFISPEKDFTPGDEIR